MDSVAHDQFVLVVFPAMQVAVLITVFTVLVICCVCVVSKQRERQQENVQTNTNRAGVAGVQGVQERACISRHLTTHHLKQLCANALLARIYRVCHVF